MKPAPDFSLLLEAADYAQNPLQLEQFTGYLNLVWDYNPVLNLTAYSGAAEWAAELVGESLRLLDCGEIALGSRVADIGSGNGSPVVPLAIRLPHVSFTAVEANSRRCAFLRTVTARIKLANLEVANSRVEEYAQHGHKFDIVVSRAFAKPGKFIQAALTLAADAAEVRGYAGSAPGDIAEAASTLGLGSVNFVEYKAKMSPRHVWSVRL